MNNLEILLDDLNKDELIFNIKERIMEFNNDLLKSSAINVVADTEKRKIYSLFSDYYIFKLSDVSFYELATNEEFKDKIIVDINGFVKSNMEDNISYNTLSLSNEYVLSIINIINFKATKTLYKTKYQEDYKKHLYSFILDDKRIISSKPFKRKMRVERYQFNEVNCTGENNFHTDLLYLEILKLIDFYKITPSVKEIFDFLKFIVKKSNYQKLFLELPIFEDDDKIYPFFKITYPEDTTFVAENIPLFINIGEALSFLSDIEINIVIPRVDKERELDFIKRLLNNNYQHTIIFHIIHPYDLSFKSIDNLKKFETLILDFTDSEINSAEKLLEVVKIYKSSMKDIRGSLIFRREVCIKTKYFDDEKILNFFVNRGYKTFYFDKNSDQKKMMQEINKIKTRRKTLKVSF